MSRLIELNLNWRTNRKADKIGSGCCYCSNVVSVEQDVIQLAPALFLEELGEVAERLKAPLSKSGTHSVGRGFKSHPLRHHRFGVIEATGFRDCCLWLYQICQPGADGPIDPQPGQSRRYAR